MDRGVQWLTHADLEDDEPEYILTAFEHDWQDLGLVEEGGQDGYRYGDVHWANGVWVPTHGASVAIPNHLVDSYDLWPGAAKVPEDETKSHYLVAVWHQLHCLSEIRDAIYYVNGTFTEWPRPEPFQWDHIIHCIEAVRQGLLCAADPTLIPLDNYWPGIPNGQLHVCRNSDALFDWTSRHGYPLPKYTKQAPPARTHEWYNRTRNLHLGPWQPNPAGPPVDEDLVRIDLERYEAERDVD